MRIRTKVGIGLFLLIAALILSRPVVDALTRQNPLPGNTAQDELSSERVKMMAPDEIVKLLNLPAGSTVLDLGAGFGMYSFRLGRAVGPTGNVYATDVDPKTIAHLNDLSRKEGAVNVTAVQVSGHGLDAFYRDHQFDVIFASDVITEIRSPESFFDALRPSLKAGTGRLWIVTMRPDPDFTSAEFGDPGLFQRALLSGERQSPIVRRLSPAAQQALAAQPTAASAEPFAALALADLNKMLEDPTLWPEAQEKKWALNQQDANLRHVLSEALAKKGLFAAQASVTDDTRRILRLLNRILLLDLLGSDVWCKAIALNKLTQAQLKPLLAPLTFQTFWGRPAFLDEVGYEVVREHTSIPYCCVWEFKRKR
jgi:2-polyprenyl-3-methyl-5-hydroxy-6-metoxy-1,4-benzoquinol methylase